MVAELVPAAERALDVARRALGTPQGSVPAVLMALRAVADVRQQQVMADAEVERTRAEVERAAGTAAACSRSVALVVAAAPPQTPGSSTAIIAPAAWAGPWFAGMYM